MVPLTAAGSFVRVAEPLAEKGRCHAWEWGLGVPVGLVLTEQGFAIAFPGEARPLQQLLEEAAGGIGAGLSDQSSDRDGADAFFA
jgi:hypothetical protein